MNKSTTTKPMGASDEKKESIVDQAKGMVSSGVSAAKEGVSHSLDVRKERAVGTIDDVADAVRRTGKKLDAGPIPDLAERAANGIDRVARFFESKELTDAITGVERFARREPALFLGGALAIGLVAGRFLKSSSSRVEELGVDEGEDYEELLDDEDIEEEWDVGGNEPGEEFSSLASKDIRSERPTDPMGFTGRTQATATPSTPPTPTALAGSSATGGAAIGGGVNVGGSSSSIPKGRP